MENTTDFFAYTLSFQKKKKEQKQNTKDSFPSFPSKNNFFYSWIHQKKRTAKKKKQSLQEESKKRRVKQNEKPLFKRQKNKTWKIY